MKQFDHFLICIIYSFRDIGNDDGEDPYSNEGYSRVESAGTDNQQQGATKAHEDTQGYSVVEAAGTQIQLRNTARYQEDPYSNQGYSRVESAGTEAQPRLSTALLITNSNAAAGDSEEYEYSYTHLRFSDSKSAGRKEKGKKSGKEKEEKSEVEKEKGEIISELGEEEVKSEPRKEKEQEKATVTENQGGKVVAQRKILIEYTPVVVVSRGGAKDAHDDEEPTAAANPFGVILESPESFSSSSATVVSKPKKDPKPTPSKISAAVSKLQRDLKFSESASATAAKPKKHPKLAEFSSASVEISNVKKELKVSRPRTSLPKFKKDSKSGQPKASANAAAGKEEKKDERSRASGLIANESLEEITEYLCFTFVFTHVF